MSSLPREIHEVLEHEYVSMYGPLRRVDPAFTPDQIIDVQWVLSILRACDLAEDPLASHAAQTEDVDDARRSLAAKLNAMLATDPAGNPGEDNRVRAEQRSALCTRLIQSPALTISGRMLIEQYDDLFAEATSDAALQGIHRRIVDDAFTGAVKPMRDLRLASLYAQLHARAVSDVSKARTALCVSGGGARSATFALGVIQGLASAKILDRFDFLSTVAGGGYVGSWLSSWARRHPFGMSGVQEDLASADTGVGGYQAAFLTASAVVRPSANAQKIEPDPKPVRHLRDYMNKPAMGLLSAETWTTIALYARNLLLNLLVIVPVMTLAFGLPRFYAFFTGTTFWVPVWLYPSTTVICLFLAFRYIGMHRPVPHDTRVEAATSNADAAYFRGCVLPLLGAAVSVTLFWADVHSGLNDLTNLWITAAATLAGLLTTFWPYAVYYRRLERAINASSVTDAGELRRRLGHKKLREILALLIGLVWAALFLWFLLTQVFDKPLQNFNDLMLIAERAPADRAGSSYTPWAAFYICFAVPAILLAFYVQMAIFVGISSRYNEDSEREWWARGSAWLLITSFGWIVVSALGIFGPPALYHTPLFVKSAGGIAGVITAILGFSGKTKAFRKAREDLGVAGRAGYAALALAAPVFFLLVISLCTVGITFAVQQVKPVMEVDKWESRKYALDASLNSKATRKRPSRAHPDVELVEESRAMPRVSLPLLRSLAHYRTVSSTEAWEVLALLAIAAVAFVISRTIGSNKFSMHALYRNRLIRTYLGASRYNRRPHPFTGFDERDDLQMYALRPELLTAAALIRPAAFFDSLRDGARNHSEGLEGRRLARRVLAQHLWSRFFEATQKQLARGRITRESIDVVVRNLNAVLLDETRLLEDVENLGLDAHFWCRPGPDRIPYPPALRNRAVFDYFFGDVVTPMPRPHDAPAEATTFRGDEFPRTASGVRRGPLHVVNLTVNLVSADKVAWQQRMLQPFTVSPYDSGGLFVGYRDSRRYGGDDGVSLGTAMTISGAAASSDMGYHSSPAMNFLLTLFNFRLGWWLGNPGPAGAHTFRHENPTTLLGPMVSEMVAGNNDSYEWVYLSDGGHFENLGLFEMILRRCHYIILTDASADPRFTYEDLGNAVRKIRADLGVPIDIEEMRMTPRDDDDNGGGGFPEGRYVATATIRYSAVDGPDAKNGVLIYLKPGVYNDPFLPVDVLNYARESRSFPHESTSDQSFSEAQFESYRALGRHVVNEICSNYPDRADAERRMPIAKQFGSVAQFAEFVEANARPARVEKVTS